MSPRPLPPAFPWQRFLFSAASALQPPDYHVRASRGKAGIYTSVLASERASTLCDFTITQLVCDDSRLWGRIAMADVDTARRAWQRDAHCNGRKRGFLLFDLCGSFFSPTRSVLS